MAELTGKSLSHFVLLQPADPKYSPIISLLQLEVMANEMR
jgi:hypothetical protein